MTITTHAPQHTLTADTSTIDPRRVRSWASSTLTGDRYRAALHLYAEPATLVALAADDAAYVRRAVAANPSAPSSVLIDLAYDVHADVRLAVAANPAAPAQALDALREDAVAFVRLAAHTR